jgi:hypothetical protein
MPRERRPVPCPFCLFTSFALLTLLALAGGCGHGGKGATAAGAAAPPIDADPYALLPPAAIAIVRVEAKAVFGNPAIGPQISAMADSLVPLGDDSGMRASRDVARVLVASYATSQGDAAAVLTGTFDVDKISHATKTKTGAPITAEAHGAATVYRADRVAWTPLTPRTLIAGSEEAVGWVLDRVAKGNPDRWEPAWMMTTLETPSTTFAAAGDFASRPLTAAVVGSISLPWVSALHQVKATGVLKSDAIDVAATFTYGDPGQASQADDSIKKSVHMLDLLGVVIGVRLQGFSTRVEGPDVHCSFGLDSPTMHTLLELAPKLLLPGAA